MTPTVSERLRALEERARGAGAIWDAVQMVAIRAEVEHLEADFELLLADAERLRRELDDANGVIR